MKKVAFFGMLALCCVAMSQQQASAWINSRFGVGFNWEWQSGGNVAGWGAWRNGQPPGPEIYGQGWHGHHGHHGQHSSFPNFQPTPYGSLDIPLVTPSYAAPNSAPGAYQFATYPRPVYYYPVPYGR